MIIFYDISTNFNTSISCIKRKQQKKDGKNPNNPTISIITHNVQSFSNPVFVHFGQDASISKVLTSWLNAHKKCGYWQTTCCVKMIHNYPLLGLPDKTCYSTSFKKSLSFLKAGKTSDTSTSFACLWRLALNFTKQNFSDIQAYPQLNRCSLSFHNQKR